MSNIQSDSINYQQFDEISEGSEFYQSNKLKMKHERKNKIKNKLIKLLPTILSIVLFFLLIILLIQYYKNYYEYKRLEGKVMDHIFFPYHSDLIPDLNILRKLKNWIKQIIYEKTGKQYKPSLRMYYKATIDGVNSFHEKTDKWEGYILLIKDEKNNIFGGYTSLNFKGGTGGSITDLDYGIEKIDKTSFLFNLNKDEIYTVLENNSRSHIYGDIEEGPVFGLPQNSDLAVASKFLTVKSQSNFPQNYNLNGDKNIKINKLRLTNGQKYFLIKELEVFRVNLL